MQEINDQADEDFNIGKEKMIEKEKVKLEQQFDKLLQDTEVNLKIEKSAEMNKARIEKMQKTAQLVNSLLADAKLRMHDRIAEDKDAYRELLKNLLVQGLIKMIEPVIWLRVREEDLDLIKSIKDEAVAEYKQ